MSNDLNRFTGIGRLTKDPELKSTQSGTSICNFSIASNKTFVSNGEKKEQVSYFNCIAWGKAGEIINQYMKKGNQIIIDGHLQQDRWQDKDGKSRDSIKIIVDNFQFIGGSSQKPLGIGESIIQAFDEKSGGLGKSVNDQPNFDDIPETSPFNDIDIPF